MRIGLVLTALFGLVLTLYVWMQHSMVQILSICQSDPPWHESGLHVSKADLQRHLISLRDLGKRIGLSDKDLKIMMKQGLKSEVEIHQGFRNFRTNATTLIKDQRQTSSNGGSDLAGYQGSALESGRSSFYR